MTRRRRTTRVRRGSRAAGDALRERGPGQSRATRHRRVGSPAAARHSRSPIPAAAAASARISGSSRSNPPQNASRLAASANRAPAPISTACAAARSAPGVCAGKRSGHTSGSLKATAQVSACARIAAGWFRTRPCPQDRGRGRHPLDLPQHPLDPLGGEVRERAGRGRRRRPDGRSACGVSGPRARSARTISSPITDRKRPLAEKLAQTLINWPELPGCARKPVR